jgi:4a-hydroxytetrahydrobiopterin dehydratase
MPSVVPLRSEDLAAAVSELTHWTVQEGKLHAEFRFDNFVQAFAFMTQVAFAAESLGHHPEWSNVYNRVVIDLTTHDAGDAVTALDIDLARQIDALYRPG